MERLDIEGTDVIICYEKLPRGIRGFTTPREWGYLIIINRRLNKHDAFLCLLHEVNHIRQGDLYSERSCEEIEEMANKIDPEVFDSLKKSILGTYGITY